MKCTRLILTGLILVFGASRTWAAETVRLKTEALTEVTEVNDKGETKKRLVEAVRVTPGDEVVYAIEWENAGLKPADAVMITNPIPHHMVCVAVEDAPTVRATVSVNGGKTFAPLALLTVPGPNGTTRPAVMRDCTHVRWTFDNPVAPGHKGTLHFRASLL